jgi:hypothetical protein
MNPLIMVPACLEISNCFGFNKILFTTCRGKAKKYFEDLKNQTLNKKIL